MLFGCVANAYGLLVSWLGVGVFATCRLGLILLGLVVWLIVLFLFYVLVYFAGFGCLFVCVFCCRYLLRCACGCDWF